MAILSKGTTFTSTQQVTSTNLNNLVDSATFVAGSGGTTDNSTLEVNGAGSIQAKDGGITAAKLATNSVSTAKIVDGNVTPEKLSTGAPTWNGTNSITLSFSDQDTVMIVENTSSTSAQYPGFKADNYCGTHAGYCNVQLRRARGSDSSPAANQSNDRLGQISWHSHTGSSFEEVARVAAFAGENHSGSALGSFIQFATTPNGATSPTEAARISPTQALLVGSGTDNNAVIFRVTSTSRASVPFPAMTTAQRDAISSPVAGSFVYNTTTKKLNFYNGTSWEAVTSA